MVKKYKRSDKIQLSKNFRLDEFKCKCGKCDPILVDDALVILLQKIRDHFGRSVNVNSGYRCAKHNATSILEGLCFEVPMLISDGAKYGRAVFTNLCL